MSVNEVWDPEPGPCPAAPPGRPVYTADLRTHEKHLLCLSHGPPQPTRCRPGVNAMAPAGCSLMGAGGVPALGLWQRLRILRPGTPATLTPTGGAAWAVSKRGFHSHSATDFYGVSVVSFFFF